MASGVEGVSKESSKCVIHVAECSETVKIFTAKHLKKCQDAQLVYKFRAKTKYSTIQVPESLENSPGYHPSCYSKFTSVSSQEVQLAVEKQNFLDNTEQENQPAHSFYHTINMFLISTTINNSLFRETPQTEMTPTGNNSDVSTKIQKDSRALVFMEIQGEIRGKEEFKDFYTDSSFKLKNKFYIVTTRD
ncbi:hypothetical protein OUZ56_010127 [Daphnia magna]|uniref:Uncharacterized protein n=1 Tax=Daphnia magna TaxID=35525 RepID=A0ABR0AHU8_9CRUS|nr:hypothetical protein OUZ56_010127 [Daphnia magna]